MSVDRKYPIYFCKFFIVCKLEAKMDLTSIKFKFLKLYPLPIMHDMTNMEDRCPCSLLGLSVFVLPGYLLCPEGLQFLMLPMKKTYGQRGETENVRHKESTSSMNNWAICPYYILGCMSGSGVDTQQSSMQGTTH